MESVDRKVCEELSDYVDKLVTTGQKELEKNLLKKLKNISKTSDSYVEHVHRVVMTYLEKEHSQVRYSCLLLINEFFQRSHAFRNQLLSCFQRFLELTAETDPEELLPPPKNVAKDLKIKTLELVQEWHQKFGEGYKKLRLGYNFLRSCKKIDFNNIDAQSSAQRRREEQQREQQARIDSEKTEKVTKEIEQLSVEIESTITQLNNCLCILFPSPDDLFQPMDFSDPQPCCSKQLLDNNDNNIHLEKDFPSVLPSNQGDGDINKCDTKKCKDFCRRETNENLSETLHIDDSEKDLVREHGLGNLKYSININVSKNTIIEKNENTSIVIENLNELYDQVTSKYLPTVGNWLQILSKQGSSTNALKKAIDLKNELKSVIAKCADLKIYTPPKLKEPVDSSDNDDEFEEVESKEGYEPVIPPHKRKEYGIDIDSSIKDIAPCSKFTNKDWSLKPENEELQDPTSRLANIAALYKKVEDLPDTKFVHNSPTDTKSADISDDGDDSKKQLLAQAPRRPYDIDLYFWEEEKIEPPEEVKFDYLHKFWTPFEHETTEFRKEEQIASLRMRKIEFSGKFQPVKWSCRAPLPSGKLCPRKDRYKCPLHGPIVPRDEMGNPVHRENQAEIQHTVESTSSTISENAEIPDWQDPQYLQDLKAATGIDLELPSTSKRSRKDKKQHVKRRKKYPGLVDIKKSEDSSRKRLEKKVLNKSSLRRIAETLDTVDQKRIRDKYGNQWQYSFDTA